MNIRIIFALASCSLVFLSGCFGPKYIPSSYFLSKHELAVKVRPFPAPQHIEQSNRSSDGALSNLVGSIAQSARSNDMRKVFSAFDADELQQTLQKSIQDKVRDNYKVSDSSRDLVVDVLITNWGWILPTGSFGIRTGSYQLVIVGTVRVYDVHLNRKEIANIRLNSTELLKDEMSNAETKRKIARAIDEFADLASEFLWRSDQK